MTETVHVLLVDPGGGIEERVAAALAEGDADGRLRLHRAAGPQDAAAAAARGEADVALLTLLDTALPAVELRAAAPGLPVVVIVAAAEDEALAAKALQLGATDYLVADRLYGTLLVRCLRHAVEVARVRSRLAELRDEWPASLLPDGGGEAAAASLREALPRQFEELADDYRQILDLAVAQILYRVEHPVEQRMTELARRAGELWAGPRDAVEIHAAVMKVKEQQEGPQRIRLYAAEGRLRLLELMGKLVGYYRRLSLGR